MKLRMLVGSAVVGFASSLAQAGAPPAQPGQPAQPGVAPPGAVPPAATVPGLTEPKQKASYGIGMTIGGSMKSGQLTAADLDMQAFVRGITDALAGQKPAIAEQEMQQVMMEFQKAIQARQVEFAKAQSEKNKKDGEAFLTANKAQADVKTTASGLQYKVLKSGAGATPAATDQVTTHYKGTLLDGTVFDSSYDRGAPATFPVSGVIKGWTEALQLMKVGDKWQLFIPSNLAYGERGAGEDIGPNSTLVFEIELLDVKKGQLLPQ